MTCSRNNARAVVRPPIADTVSIPRDFSSRSARIAVARLDEDETCDGDVLFARRSIEIAVEKRPRPRISYGMEIANMKVNRDRPVGREHGNRCRAFASAAVLVKANTH